MQYYIIPAIWACILVLVGSPASAQKDPNLDRCLQGLPSCDVSRLRADDIRYMADEYRRRNADACRSGSPACEPAALSDAEWKALVAANHQRNMDRCRAGSPNCDPLGLTAEEANLVSADR